MNPPGLDLHHLAGVYALDALDGHEVAVFEEHFRLCELCQVEVAEFRETAALLAVAAAKPVPRQTRKIVDAIRSIEQPRTRWRRLFDSLGEETERRRHA